MNRFLRLIPAALASSGLVAFSACSRSSETLEITETRTLRGPEREIRIVESAAERYRLPSSLTRPADASASTEGLPFVWEAPEGWTRQEGLPMRDLSFSFGDDGEGEVYLSRLPGAGGGLVANVNRWRGQMGLEPLPDEEVEALPSRLLFGLPATWVDLSGDYAGMGSAAEAKPDYRMLGVILSSDAGAVFVKLTGPAALVDEHEERFQQFCQSLAPR